MVLAYFLSSSQSMSASAISDQPGVISPHVWGVATSHDNRLLNNTGNCCSRKIKLFGYGLAALIWKIIYLEWLNS